MITASTSKKPPTAAGTAIATVFVLWRFDGTSVVDGVGEFDGVRVDVCERVGVTDVVDVCVDVLVGVGVAVGDAVIDAVTDGDAVIDGVTVPEIVMDGVSDSLWAAAYATSAASTAMITTRRCIFFFLGGGGRRSDNGLVCVQRMIYIALFR